MDRRRWRRRSTRQGLEKRQGVQARQAKRRGGIAAWHAAPESPVAWMAFRFKRFELRGIAPKNAA